MPRSLWKGVPARLKGSRPRDEHGRFLTRAVAARVIGAYRAAETRRERARVHQPPARPVRAARPGKPRRARRRPAGAGEARRIDHLLTFKFDAKGRSYRRDLIVPATRGSSASAILKQARAELPAGAKSLERFLKLGNLDTIAEGPTSTRQKTELR